MRRRDLLALFACRRDLCADGRLWSASEQVRQIGVLIGLAENDPDAPVRVCRPFSKGSRRWAGSIGATSDHLSIGPPMSSSIRSSAKEMVALQPDLIVAGSSLVVSALLRETRTIPIVFVTASDPVGDGFVASLARPGGNATGFTNSTATMGGKWLELIKEVAPGVTRVAIMFNRETAPTRGAYFLQAIEALRRSVGLRPLRDAGARCRRRSISALADIAREPGSSLIVMPDQLHDQSIARDHRAGGPASPAGGLPVSLLRDRGRPDVLWCGCGRPLPSDSDAMLIAS